MASMKESVSHTCWFLGLVISLCFVVFTITAQQPKAVDCKPQDSKTCPNIERCNFGFVLSLSMYIWMKYAIVGFLMSGTLLWSVRATIDSAAGEEGRFASDEEKDYKAAREEHRLATDAVDEASEAYNNAKLKVHKDPQLEGEAHKPLDEALKNALDDFQKSIAKMNRAAKKMETSKPARGMDRVHWKKWTRFLYCASLFFLTGGALCANVSFFLSLESEIGCVENIAYYIPHVAPALLVLAVAIRFSIVGTRSL